MSRNDDESSRGFEPPAIVGRTEVDLVMMGTIVTIADGHAAIPATAAFAEVVS